MNKKTAASFLLGIMVSCMVSDAAASFENPLKTEASSLVTGTTWGSTANERTLDEMRVSSGAQNTNLYAAHKREMKQKPGGGAGHGRKLMAPPTSV